MDWNHESGGPEALSQALHVAALPSALFSLFWGFEPTDMPFSQDRLAFSI